MGLATDVYESRSPNSTTETTEPLYYVEIRFCIQFKYKLAVLDDIIT